MSYPPHGTAIDTVLADVDTRLHTLETTVPVDLIPLAQRVVALEEAVPVMADGLTAIGIGLDITQASLGTVSGRVTAAEQTISNVTGTVADLVTGAAAQDARLDDHNGRINGQAALLNAQNDQLTLIDTALGNTAGILTGHGQELTAHALNLQGHGDSITAVQSRVTNAEFTLNSLGSVIPRLAELETFRDFAAGEIGLINDVLSVQNSTNQSVGNTLENHTASITAVQSRVTALENAPGGAAAGMWPGYLSVDQFAGADATAKFRAALAYAASASSGRIPAIVLPPGTVLAPGTSPFMLFNGAGVVGGIVPETEFSGRQRVTVSGAAPNGVFDHPNDTRDIVIANIGWEGPGSSQICRFLADNANRLCYSLFHGVSFDNFTSVLRKRFLGFDWTGTGYCNNSTETPFEFSGSDWKIWMDGFYLDSPHLADDDYLLHVKSGNKAVIGSVFVTGDGPTPVRVSGGQMVRILNLEMEAEGAPRKTAGAGLFVSGGNVIVDNAWFFRTMSNPAATGRGDAGVIHAEGNGTLLRVKHATFGEYNTNPLAPGGPLNVPERPGGYTENHVYAGGTAKVYLDVASPWNMQAHSGVGGHTNARPLQVQKAGSGQILTSAYTPL